MALLFTTKVNYNYYRTYNSLIGRYIQSDPLGQAAGFNTYNYVEGNPFGFTDSLGLAKMGKNGEEIFKPIEGNHFEIKESIVTEISRGYYIEGYIYTNKGNPIRTSKFVFPNKLTNSGDYLKNYDYNCHGLTFTNGRYWSSLQRW